jgi:hypothetical protein
MVIAPFSHVLRHKRPSDREVEDALAQSLDLVGANSQSCQSIKHKSTVIAECLGIRNIEAGEARRDELDRVLPRARCSARLAGGAPRRRIG